MSNIEDLLDAAAGEKKKLNDAKRAANEKAREMVRKAVEAEESAVDASVRAAYNAGISKSVIAKALGESRVTINDRLDRTSGDENPNRVAVNASGKSRPNVADRFSYVERGDGGLIKVTLNGKSAMFEYTYDDVANQYWFHHGDGDEEIITLFDGAWEGEEYDAANAWLKANPKTST